MMNCIVIDDDAIAIKLLEIQIQKVEFLNLVKSFKDPEEALKFLSEQPTDLVFLDIEMPEMNGLTFIKSIEDKKPQIILTTSNKEYAIEAFESGVTDYLVKPIEFDRFILSVERAKKMFEDNVTPHIEDEALFVKKGNSLVKINNSDIVWIESLGDYVALNTEKERFIIHTTMKAMEKKLPETDYLRVHRSYIMKIDKIEKIKDDIISYKEKIIPIGKTYRKSVYQKLNRIK